MSYIPHIKATFLHHYYDNISNFIKLNIFKCENDFYFSILFLYLFILISLLKKSCHYILFIHI